MIETVAKPLYLTGNPISTPGGSDRLAPVAALLGLEMRGWWREVGEAALDRQEGRWRYPRVVLSLPRQSGKTSMTSVVALERCLSTPDASVHYTCQSRADAVARFSDLLKLLRRSSLRQWTGARPPRPGDPWDWRGQVGKGIENIQFANGSSIEVFAPRPDSLHGSTTSLVVIDEARFFDERLGADLMAAILPSQLTTDGQVWITSTAGGPESTWLMELMEQGRASVDDPVAQTCYAEYGVGDDVTEDELLEAAWAAHPASGLPGGPSRPAMTFAAATMPAWQFAHEYGNKWRTEAAEALIPAAWWSATRTDKGLEGRVTFAIDAATDRSTAAVVACAGGVVEVVRTMAGVGWLVPEILALAERHDPIAVVVDPGGPAVTVVEALRADLGDRLVEAKTRDVVAACGAFYDGLGAGTITHWTHPALDDAASSSSRRPAGGAWVFSRANGGHLLVAAALAAWADARPAEADGGWFVA
ncbi:MAG: hypothetical protein J2P58_01820 [Acidimicrobiaceae bacterium]|nr:hypothetical protein [Acidimicrobiaceae bacterium]